MLDAHRSRNNDVVLVAKSKILIKTQWSTNGVRIYYYIGSSMVSFTTIAAGAFTAAAAAAAATTLHAMQTQNSVRNSTTLGWIVHT